MSMNVNELKSWRSVIEPHPDVAQGRYKTAEFAADLSQVAEGHGSIEYLDPSEFFRRTYLTGGLKRLLSQALKRAAGRDGEPVIQLKTAFGGGKTHSMLALYHFMRGHVSPERIDGAESILADAGVQYIPRTNVAVLVGTAEDPSRSHALKNFPGITVNTMWGEMAAQLAVNAGNIKLYDYVREADIRGVSPGSRTLKELFDSCGPCLILMDEIVAYARKLGSRKDLPAGTFGNFLSFIQEITEAARASHNSMVAAAIPESDIEIGGEEGQKALEAIEHTFGRVESIWKPVAANEGFEIVRRRLFLDCKDESARENTANAFSKMYAENKKDFPVGTSEIEYRDRIISCYPVHPEIFDRLYEDWATLERFQRTRGVLRLMAAVIHELWMRNDTGALIMPGSIPLDSANVRDELIRHLPEGWNAVIDSETDGINSIPYRIDKEKSRFGDKSAARRVARAVMLGSAPASRAQPVRGIERPYIRLGVVQPGESIADFNDALSTLQGELAYLYTDTSGSRFWYDTRPTLLKTAAERAMRFSDDEVNHEIIIRLRKERNEKPFAGVHICPLSSLDVPDEQSARLVVLGPDDGYSFTHQNESSAVKKCNDILNNRGKFQRMNRNMLMFLVPDQGQMSGLKQEVRLYLAWKSIDDEKENLNLDAAQNRVTLENVRRYGKNIDLQIKESWCWLLVPSNEISDIKTLNWESFRVTGGSDSIIKGAALTAQKEDLLVTRWAPEHLKAELDGVLWKDRDDISVSTLWEYLCQYCYLSKLSGYDVLEASVISGLQSGKFFALAESKSEDGEYIGLVHGCAVTSVSKSAYLVKEEAARKYIEPEDETLREEAPEEKHIPQNESEAISVPDETKPTSFHMSMQLKGMRIIRDVQALMDEVITHLESVAGKDIDISLIVKAKSADGFPQSVVKTVSENCKALNVKDIYFNDN